MIKKIHDVETGKVVERELNAEELKQHELDKARVAAENEALATKTTEKAALIAKLGITADEAKLLFQ